MERQVLNLSQLKSKLPCFLMDGLGIRPYMKNKIVCEKVGADLRVYPEYKGKNSGQTHRFVPTTIRIYFI
ncbi:MAG TPA: hypothetical protein DIT04_14020 [Dysgonomonas sp.]|nr:hypothetical protein [Dysgonomonas sp.]